MEKDFIFWVIKRETFRCQILPNRCPLCKATGALVMLPRPLLGKQPDKTNVVCHPALGGCNHGFHLDGMPINPFLKGFPRDPT